MSGLIGGDNNKTTADNTGKKSRKTIYIILSIIIVLGIISLVLGLHFTSEDGKFSDWSECTKECGTGIQTRTYTPKVNNGDDLPDKDILKQSCNTQPCPINGSYNNWSEYGTCVKSQTDSTPITCGTGKKSRTRTYNPPLYGGSHHTNYNADKTDLDNKLIEWENCTHDTVLNCPINGSYSEWITQAGCVKSPTDQTQITCRGEIQGVQKKTRTYNPPLYRGSHHTDYIEGRTDLENKLIEWETCTNIHRICKPENASCSSWTNDGNPFCNTSSNQYQLKQKRTYTPAIDGGTDLASNDDNDECKTKPLHEKTILVRSNEAIESSEGVCPADGIMTAFSLPADHNCTPATGKNRTQYLDATYTFPTSDANTHDSNFTALGFGHSQINDIKNLTTTSDELIINANNIEYKIKRTNTGFPYIYEIKKKVSCSDVYNFSPSQINDAWKQATGCTQDLNTTIYSQISNTENNLRYLNSLENVFNRFTAASLISNKDTQQIKLCYGTDNNTGYVTVNTNNRSNYTARAIFPPGISIAVKNIAIVENSNYRLLITEDGQLQYVKLLPTWSLLFSTNYTESDFGSIVMEHGGNLVIFHTNNSRTILWQSNTGGNSGGYLELTTNGSLIIKKQESSGVVTNVKYLYIESDVINAAWKSHTGCTQDLSANVYTNTGTTMDALQLLSNIETDVKPTFDPFTKNRLLQNKITANITTCYGSHNNTGYVTVNNNNNDKTQYRAGSIFPPGIKIAATDIAIVENSNYRLLITEDGQLQYVKLLPTWSLLYSSNYTRTNFGYIVMEHGGNLVIFQDNTSRTILWQSDTGSNSGAYLELDTDGSLYIKNSSGTIVKYLYIPSSIQDSTWTSTTGCTQPLTDSILNTLTSNRTYLSVLDSINKVIDVFNPFTAASLISNKDTDKIRLCYSTDNNTGYVTVNNNNNDKTQYRAGSIFPPGIKIAATDIAIVENSNYRLLITEDGQLQYVKLLPTWSLLFSTNYTESDFGSIVMEHGGNLVIFHTNNSRTILWQSYTGGNSGAYLELATDGSLYIKNSSGTTIIKYLYIPSSIINAAWKSHTGCTQDLSANVYTNAGTTMDALQLLSNIETDVKPKFDPYKLNNMLANTTTDYNKRKDCYGTTGYVTIDNSNKSLYTASNVLGPGFTFTKNILDDIVILRSGNYAFSLLNNGNMYIYGPGSNNNTAAFYTVGNLNTISMQHDGNLVIYNTNGTAIWNSGTSGYSGAYLELESNGSLIIKKRDSSNNVTNVKILYSNGLMTVNGNPSNFPAKSEALCTPEFSTSTTPRTQNVTVNYIFPTIENGSHDPNFTAIGFSGSQITEITALSPNNEKIYNVTVGNTTNKYTVKRINNVEPKRYEITKTLICENVELILRNWKNYEYSHTGPANNRECGLIYGACPDNQCCSSAGYCGTNSEYCARPLSDGDYNDKEPKNWKNYSYSRTVESGDRRCGTNFSNTACPDNQCCSSQGYCGTTSAYCIGSMSSGNFNDKEPKNWQNLSYSTDNRCGPDFNNTACPTDKCCSSLGYCGGVTGDNSDHCKTSQLYGKFNDKQPTAIIHEKVVKEIVLLNKYGQSIYIEPYVFKKIIDDNSINDDDNSDLSCKDKEFDAVKAYNIGSNRFDELKTSSQNMRQRYTSAVEFKIEDGSPHDNDDDVLVGGCTPFWNLYYEGIYGTEKSNLINADFKYFSPNNANSEKNWLRYDRGSSKFSYYWKVFYR